MLDDPNEQMIAKVYEFNIETCYKGMLKDNIPVSMHYSTRLYYDNDGLIHGDEINSDSKYVDVLENNFVQPNTEKEYILFLTYNEAKKVYQPAFYPYSIEIEDNKLEVTTSGTSSVYAALLEKNKSVTVITNTCKPVDIVKGITYEEFKSKFN